MTNNSVRRAMATPIDVQTLPEEENKPALRRISGYALTFDNETYIGGKQWGFYEVIRKEALANADLSDVVLCRNHDNGKTVARTSNGTLELMVDDVGLMFIADVIDTTDGLDMMKEIESGLIGGMSFHACYDIDGCRVSEKDGKEVVEVVGYCSAGAFAETFSTTTRTKEVRTQRLGLHARPVEMRVQVPESVSSTV